MDEVDQVEVDEVELRARALEAATRALLVSGSIPDMKVVYGKADGTAKADFAAAARYSK